jgi:hypothetical protein
MQHDENCGGKFPRQRAEQPGNGVNSSGGSADEDNIASSHTMVKLIMPPGVGLCIV